MIFGNNGRPSKGDNEKSILATHKVAESGKEYNQEFMYIKDCQRLQNAVFNNCDVIIEESATVKGCTFNHCVISKGVYDYKSFDKSLSKNSRNKFIKCIGIDNQYEVGIDFDHLRRDFGRVEGKKLQRAALDSDLQTVKKILLK